MKLQQYITATLAVLLIFSISVNIVWLLDDDTITYIIMEQQVVPYEVSITTYNPTNDILFPVRKPGPHQDYTNLEARQGIKYAARYGDNPSALSNDHYSVFCMWKDYESRVDNASYLYWVVSYAFNI